MFTNSVSFLECLLRVDMDSVYDISKIHTTSIFRFDEGATRNSEMSPTRRKYPGVAARVNNCKCLKLVSLSIVFAVTCI
jgi:hypothetical protein